LHGYAASELSGYSAGETIDPFTDFAGGEDLAATGDPKYQTNEIGGQPAAVYDTDDYHETTYGTTISDPVHIWAVCNALDDVDSQHVWSIVDSTTDPRPYFAIESGSQDRYTGRDSDGNSVVFGGSPDGGDHIFLMRYTGSNIELARDNSELGSGGSGGLNMEGVQIAEREGSSDFEGPIPETLIFDPTDNGYSESSMWSYFSDKYGISVS
jgi:hypothetical protein